MAVVEILTFALAGGADEAAFLREDERVQTEFVPNRPGFIRRTTARADDGSWATVLLWGSPADADAAYADLTAGDEPAAAGFLAVVDRSTLARRCYTTLD
jgi:hypothetical protein